MFYNMNMKINGKHKVLTQEMINDLSEMCDQDFMAKWDTSRQYPIRARKRLGIKSFINQHGSVSRLAQSIWAGLDVDRGVELVSQCSPFLDKPQYSYFFIFVLLVILI